MGKSPTIKNSIWNGQFWWHAEKHSQVNGNENIKWDVLLWRRDLRVPNIPRCRQRCEPCDVITFSKVQGKTLSKANKVLESGKSVPLENVEKKKMRCAAMLICPDESKNEIFTGAYHSGVTGGTKLVCKQSDRKSLQNEQHWWQVGKHSSVNRIENVNIKCAAMKKSSESSENMPADTIGGNLGTVWCDDFF